MPEIGEVARIVYYIRKRLVGKTLAKVIAQADDNVYGKVGCSAEAFEKALTGKKVLGAGQQGKYFWMIMSSPPHPLMHFGMTGWFKLINEETGYDKPKKTDEPEEWPPKYLKFLLETAEKPPCQAAFVDSRRFARIRLIDCGADEIRKVSPLVENGPDPVVDQDIMTEEWLKEKLQSKRIPVKALLLDQANISGIGNWVGDEILYHARIHPEQYSNSLTSAQISQLHKSIHYVCKFAVDAQADPSKFPEEWLFRHRWGKGKKDSPKTLPNGKKFVHMTVGGRTSCVVPSVQKKTGPVAGDMKEEAVEDDGGVEEEIKPKKRNNASSAAKATKDKEETSPAKLKMDKKRGPKQEGENSSAVNSNEVKEDGEGKQPAKKRKPNSEAQNNSVGANKQTNTTNKLKADKVAEGSGRRRSTRASGKDG